MDIVVSPYHLTSREVPALCALLLARRVVTMLPTPTDEDGGTHGRSPQATAASVPAYARFMQSLAWTTPLWKRGVLTGVHEGESAVDDVWATIDHIRSDEGVFPLRHFLPRDPFADPDAYLSAVASDLLKGGPDPGISVPVVAALDRFAARHGLVVARPRAESLAQRAEESLAKPIAQCAVPILLQASAPRLLHVRETLAESGCELRQSMALASDGASGGAPHALSQSCDRWCREFESRIDELLMGAEDDEVRPVLGHAVVTLARLPWNAALSSSVQALRSLGPKPSRGHANGTHPNGPHEHAPSVADALATRHPMHASTFVAMVVRPLGQKPSARG